MTSETKMIMDKLNEIKSEIDYIKKRVADVDTVLTTDDVESLKEAEQDLKDGKTVKL
jgi:hypothetical protein